MEELELAARLADGEVLCDGRPFGGALRLPCGDLRTLAIDVGWAARQTLAGKDSPLALGDVEPASVLGRERKFELSSDATRVSRRKRDVQRRDAVHV
jgi:hypothetical protein